MQTYLHPAESITIAPIRSPSGHDRGDEAHDERETIEQHVEGIRDQTERIRPYTVRKFDAAKTLENRELCKFMQMIPYQIDDKEVEDSP